jgi:hypothetical protein
MFWSAAVASLFQRINDRAAVREQHTYLSIRLLDRGLVQLVQDRSIRFLNVVRSVRLELHAGLLRCFGLDEMPSVCLFAHRPDSMRLGKSCSLDSCQRVCKGPIIGSKERGRQGRPTKLWLPTGLEPDMLVISLSAFWDHHFLGPRQTM